MSTDLIIAPNFCNACGNALAPADRYCSNCGTCIAGIVSQGATSLVSITTSAPTPPPPAHASIELSPSVQSILGNRWIVIGLLAAAGPIGLPALWFSPRFRPWSKITISVIYFLGTVVFPLALAWYWLDYSLRPLVEMF